MLDRKASLFLKSDQNENEAILESGQLEAFLFLRMPCSSLIQEISPAGIYSKDNRSMLDSRHITTRLEGSCEWTPFMVEDDKEAPSRARGGI